ncbi:extracellular solute-binding protein [Caballeronia sp. J97]|uniref:extracellular solute-binding protein n=1 Tax=Caballeronia sp. J97 TaxID=2805429 RepID=UPI002AB08BE5|nr:extracellular solute-binding protein [Caballeronia sp. J97]
MRCITRSNRKLVAAASAVLAAASLMCNVAKAETVLKLAYGSENVMVTTELATKFWGEIKADFEKSHPGVKVQLVPIPGGFDDIVTKVSMSYGNSSSAPDVAQLPAQEMAQWAASGYLLPLNQYVAKAPWWKDVPDAVKLEGTTGKDVIGISQGVNTSGLLYDKQVFQKAGLPADWKPKNWQDIFEAARKIKKSDPNVWPLWAITGPAGGTSALVLGAANLLMASSDPTIKDASGKWAVDTKGIREVLNFYRQASAEGLLAPSSLILNANSPALATPEYPKHHIGIGLVANYVPAAWSKSMCSPCWPEAPKFAAFTPLPTVTGGGVGYASAFGGWDLSIYKKTANPDLAWQLVDLIVSKQYVVKGANWTGFVPPQQKYWTDKEYTELAPPYQEQYGKILAISKSVPADPEYPVWAHAFEAATEALVLKPKMSVDDAVKMMKSELSNQLGDDKLMAAR